MLRIDVTQDIVTIYIYNLYIFLTHFEAVSCDLRDKWMHMKFTYVSLTWYNDCVSNGGQIDFVCDRRRFTAIPFRDVDCRGY